MDKKQQPSFSDKQILSGLFKVVLTVTTIVLNGCVADGENWDEFELAGDTYDDEDFPIGRSGCVPAGGAAEREVDTYDDEDFPIGRSRECGAASNSGETDSENSDERGNAPPDLETTRLAPSPNLTFGRTKENRKSQHGSVLQDDMARSGSQHYEQQFVRAR